MRILALDSSGLVASVAVAEAEGEEEQLIAEYTVNYAQRLSCDGSACKADGMRPLKGKKTHSQTLLPMLGYSPITVNADAGRQRVSFIMFCKAGRRGICS